MKICRLLSAFSAAAALTAVHAQADTPQPTSPPDQPPGGVSAATDPPAPGTTKPPTNANPAPAGASPLDDLKQKDLGFDYQMPMVRVVQARAQGDKPVFVKDRFVSKFGNGDLKLGYMSGMDSVNMASVEGALMFVQAEGIDELARGANERCVRKSEMAWVVFYEILIAQSNETIAQYSPGKWNLPEYGQMLPMDEGRCMPLSGDTFPPECYQFNGGNEQPNLGPFVGGGRKDDNDKAPYPDTYWFSFPHTCPFTRWGDKLDMDSDCRKNDRKGLCDLGKAPDGVECTFAYDILGWVPIDDVVGITGFEDGKYSNFTTWCEASKDHIEFQRDSKTNGMLQGLEFWKDPLNRDANGKRAEKVITMYEDILSRTFTSGMISEEDLAKFKPLPNPKYLQEINPLCYKTVPECNQGNGCQRRGFSQLCTKCEEASPGCKTDPTYTFPTLARAPTDLSEDETTSVPNEELGANGRLDGTKKTEAPSSSATTTSGAVLPMVAVSMAVAAVRAA